MYQFLIDHSEPVEPFTFLTGKVSEMGKMTSKGMVSEVIRGGDRIEVFCQADYIVVFSEVDLDEGNLLLDEWIGQALGARMRVRLLHLSNFRTFGS